MANPQADKFTRWSNELLEALLKQDLSGSEWRVINAVARLTYGYQRTKASIKVSSIMELTNLPERTVRQALKTLILRNMLLRNGVTGIQKDYDRWKKLSTGAESCRVQNLAEKGAESCRVGVQNPAPFEPNLKKTLKENIKETSEWKKLIKYLETQKAVGSPDAYLTTVVSKYGSKYLKRLLTLNYKQWYEHLDHWVNNEKGVGK